MTSSPIAPATNSPILNQVTRLSEIALRAMADFLIVHASAMAALLFVAFRLEDTPNQTIVEGLANPSRLTLIVRSRHCP